jgi:V/A-type H+/Na+-transporting ATPase subunit E
VGSELNRLLEQEAQAEQDKVLADARARAEEIRAAARREAQEIVAAGQRQVEDDRTQALARATSTASLKAAALVLVAKDEAIHAVFDQAETALRGAAADASRRRAMLHSFLREAQGDIAGGRVVVEASPDDVQAVGEACQALGLDAEVRENAEVTDGIRLSSLDGRVVVENTISGRLTRARREMVTRVAEVLWGR